MSSRLQLLGLALEPAEPLESRFKIQARELGYAEGVRQLFDMRLSHSLRHDMR